VAGVNVGPSQKEWAYGMGRSLRTGAVAFAAMMAVGGVAIAQSRCAKPEEVSAIQTAAIQQELMVAALTCNEVARFNAFQTGFGPELRASDARLARMFSRLYGPRRGEAEYHTFKTKLANESSIRSIHDNPSYCQEAGAMLASALVPNKPALITFVGATTVVIATKPADACADQSVTVVLKGGGSGGKSVRRHRRRGLAQSASLDAVAR
jgi:hypothetical protein